MEQFKLSREEFEKLSKKKQTEYYLEGLLKILQTKYKGSTIKYRNETTKMAGIKLEAVYFRIDEQGLLMIKHSGLENMLESRESGFSSAHESAKEVVKEYNLGFKAVYGKSIVTI